VIVPRAARIEAGHDGAEAVAPLGVSKDVAAQAETLVVIFAVVVGLPAARQHPAGELGSLPLDGFRASRRPATEKLGQWQQPTAAIMPFTRSRKAVALS
jgi:hypothetical protein